MQVVTFSGCSFCSVSASAFAGAWRVSHPGPQGPPCSCAPAPGAKQQCVGGQGECARSQWLCDKPAPLVRPLARRTVLALDPFGTPSIVPRSVAPHQVPPSSCPAVRPGLVCRARRDQGAFFFFFENRTSIFILG